MHAMILAAGLGTRLRPYSDHCPKPLFPVLGQPLLYHIIGQLRRSGFGPITVNAHHLSDHFARILTKEDDVIIQIENEILGTGGGLRKALPGFGREPILVINGDIFHSLDLGEIYGLHLASSAPVSMVVHDRPRFNNLHILPGSRVSGLRVDRDQVVSGSGTRLLAFAGIHIIDPAILRKIPEEGFYDIIDLYKDIVANEVEINAIEVRDNLWTDIGTKTDYLELHGRLLADHDLARALGFGSLNDSQVHIGKGVELGSNVVFKDWCWVGDGVRIGNGSRISRSVIWDGAIVKEGVEIEDEIVVR